MITTAVILAAGRGSRLGSITDDKPKGFVQIDNIHIIERSIRKLIGCGIDKIIIGTGYRSEMYEALVCKYPVIECIKNDNFIESGSMKTLLTVSPLIKDDFLLLESDLIYEFAALKTLLNSGYSDCILCSNPSGSMDEVFIETDDNCNLLALSKAREKLNRINGELVGISKVSRMALEKMCEYQLNVADKLPKLDYEHAFTGIYDSIKFHVEMVENLVWCEIDDQSHLNRAKTLIYPKICESERRWEIKRNILLNPGPATTTDSVKYAQIVPDICPREVEFGSLLSWICKKLSDMADPSGSSVATLFCGSGTAAMESIISSVVSDGYLVIVSNGAYGKRISEIARTYNLNHIIFESDPCSSVDVKSLLKFINDVKTKHKLTHLAVVHHETTTGVLNDIESIGKICSEENIELIVDAISSFAAVPIDMIQMNISHMAATSNKNLQGMAGISFVISRKSSIQKLQNTASKSYYLDLYSQYKYLQQHKQTRFTPPVQVLYALRQAIVETISEGIINRYKRYTKSWKTLIKGLNRLGLECPVAIRDQSHLLTTVSEPSLSKYNFEEMHDFLLKKGFTIYPGKLNSSKTFRVANIGEINSDDINRFIDAVESYFNTKKQCR